MFAEGKENMEWIVFPSPGDLSDPGIEPKSPALQADALTSEPPGKPNTGSLAHNKHWTKVPACFYAFFPKAPLVPWPYVKVLKNLTPQKE